MVLEHFLIEILSPFAAPSKDARLVIFADEQIHEEHTDATSHLRACVDYATLHKMYLVSGLLVHRRNLCLCLISPAGKAVCRQGAIHLALPLQGKLLPADEVRVAHTDLGNIYLCVDADIFHPEPSRAAALKGADVVISIQNIDPAEETPDRVLRTAWNVSQTNNVYVVNLSGGGCTVTCPAPVTRARDGYILRRADAVPTRFALNMERLDEVRANFDLVENINTTLVETYAERLGR